LNFIWEAWLGLDTHWHDDEIIVNDVRGKTEDDWADMMKSAFSECFRILKPGRWLSVCYHDTSEGTWQYIQDLFAEIGFIADETGNALFIDTAQKSIKQITADKVTKRDLVINFRKPRPGEASAAITITGDEDATTFNDQVRAILRDLLSAQPGQTKDRLYDEVVSRMVRAGRMQPHDFDGLLRSVALPAPTGRGGSSLREVGGEGERWYLRAAEDESADAAESAREDAAAGKLAAFMNKELRAKPESEGVHYSDLFEHYVYSVKDKPRRALAEWLPDYFYKTEDGTWRPPADEEEAQAKAELRARGMSRQIKRYAAYLQQAGDHGAALPPDAQPSDATLAEWIRHCKRAGLYDVGRLLFERGGIELDTLPEEVAVNVEEDYQVCVRRLNKATEK
jgi:hypothetical protein